MLSRKTKGATLLFAGLIQVFALTTACGGGDGSNAAQGGIGGTGSSEGGSSSDTGGTDSGNGGTTGSEGGTSNGQGGTDIAPPTHEPEFEGVDLEGVPLVPTPGCEGGFDADAKSLALTIDEESHSVLVDAPEGYLRANGVVCSAPDGSPVLAASVEHLSITGTAGDDVSIIDLLVGDFGNGLLGSEGAIVLDLGTGTDKLIVRGTRGDDHMACAAVNSIEDSPIRVDLGSRAHSLKASGVENMLVSMGPGNDSFDGSESSLRCNATLELFGGADSDMLQGGSKNDVLNGGEGNDEIQMATSQDGADIVNGGADDDLVSYARRTKSVTVRLCNVPSATGCPAGECICPNESGETSERDVIVNCEDADGGSGNDNLIGDELSNVLSGKDGNDLIEALGGADQIYGDAGDDTIIAGNDADLVIGGSGKNTLDGGEGDDICFISPRDTKKACETPVDVP
ncbi:MAG: hypothetical protein ACOY0T_38040 [Myxococcota bacterium]